MTNQIPPIVKLTETVLILIEQAVQGFARKHKYAIGADLRGHARDVMRAAQRAWRDPERRGERIEALAEAVDELKLSLRIAQRLQAFKSFAQFETIARPVSDLGRQCGGWRKKHLKGQNPQPLTAAGRAEILSASSASSEEVHP